MKKKKLRACAYCGEQNGHATEDHVIPDSLWENSNPPAMLKVPACNACNFHWSNYEAQFRTFLALIAKDHHPIASKIVRGGAGERHYHGDAKFQKFFMNAMTLIPRYNEQGVYIGHHTNVRIDEYGWKKVFGKILRGLFFYQMSRPVPATHEVALFFGSDLKTHPGCREVVADLMCKWENRVFGDSVFAMNFASVPEDQDLTACLCIFFGCVPVFGMTQPISGNRIVDPSHPAIVTLDAASLAKERAEMKQKFCKMRRS